MFQTIYTRVFPKYFFKKNIIIIKKMLKVLFVCSGKQARGLGSLCCLVLYKGNYFFFACVIFLNVFKFKGNTIYCNLPAIYNVQKLQLKETNTLLSFVLSSGKWGKIAYFISHPSQLYCSKTTIQL